jgi:hypothetical protein
MMTGTLEQLQPYKHRSKIRRKLGVPRQDLPHKVLYDLTRNENSHTGITPPFRSRMWNNSAKILESRSNQIDRNQERHHSLITSPDRKRREELNPQDLPRRIDPAGLDGDAGRQNIWRGRREEGGRRLEWLRRLCPSAAAAPPALPDRERKVGTRATDWGFRPRDKTRVFFPQRDEVDRE